MFSVTPMVSCTTEGSEFRKGISRDDDLASPPAHTPGSQNLSKSSLNAKWVSFRQGLMAAPRRGASCCSPVENVDGASNGNDEISICMSYGMLPYRFLEALTYKLPSHDCISTTDVP